MHHFHRLQLRKIYQHLSEHLPLHYLNVHQLQKLDQNLLARMMDVNGQRADPLPAQQLMYQALFVLLYGPIIAALNNHTTILTGCLSILQAHVSEIGKSLEKSSG